jgi:PII-like signaling protein
VAECLALTSYVGERRRAGRRLLASALADLYLGERIAASVVLRGMQGFGQRHQLRTDRSLTLSEDLPLVSVAVDTRPRIEAVLDHALALAGPSLVTVEPASLHGDGTGPAILPEGPADEAAKLTVYLRRGERAYQIPAFEAICDLLYRRRVDGATALLGVDGSIRGQRPQGGFFGRHAEAPMMVTAVGSWDQIGRVLADVSGLLRHPLLTVEPVRVCKRDGLVLDVPDLSLGTGEHDLPLGQKLTIYTSAAAQVNGQPIHRALARRLLAAGISGVTTLRGVWGFHGNRAPHGDGALHLARHVPAVTTVIDSAERILAAFAIIDELTAGQGLVTSQAVAATRAAASAPR